MGDGGSCGREGFGWMAEGFFGAGAGGCSVTVHGREKDPVQGSEGRSRER